MLKASNTMKLLTSALVFVIPMLLADSQAAKAQPDSFGIRIAKIPNYKGQRWTLCHARNENPHTVTAYFDVYPVNQQFGNEVHLTIPALGQRRVDTASSVLSV